MATIFYDKTDVVSYMNFQYDRLRELAVELNILQKLRSPKELEGIEHSINYSVCWPVSDRWKKRRASFVSQYDKSKYDIFDIPVEETMAHYNNVCVTTIGSMWEFFQDMISDYHRLDGYGFYKKEDIRDRIVQQSIYLFELEWEIDACTDCVFGDQNLIYSRMEEYIASMNVTDFTFTNEWNIRRENIAQFLTIEIDDDDDDEIENEYEYEYEYESQIESDGGNTDMDIDTDTD